MGDLLQLATDERRDLADLLDTLSPEQWRHASLCDGWSVRDVVAHILSYEELGYLDLAALFARTRFRPGVANRVRLDACRDHGPEELKRMLRACLRPRGLTAGMGGGIGLADCVVHHQDIRRPLGLHRDVPEDRLVRALDITLRAPTLPSRRNARGLHLVANDLDWHHGSGVELTGPGEALLMALAGRSAALGDLSGPGLATLRDRLHPAG